ncbi:MAG: hypothetical protein GXO07_03565 [Crenarchaeota archaeon]|nr:hypothetical protein [Thermoproteota archaeon]
MRARVVLPYPLVLAEEGGRKLVLFLEKPFKVFTAEDPWALVHLRGASLFAGRKLVRQIVFQEELTLAVTSFDPKPAAADPEAVMRQLFGGEGPCESFEAWGVRGLRCGEVLLFRGRVELPPLGFGVVRSRVDVLGPRFTLEA